MKSAENSKEEKINLNSLSFILFKIRVYIYPCVCLIFLEHISQPAIRVRQRDFTCLPTKECGRPRMSQCPQRNAFAKKGELKQFIHCMTPGWKSTVIYDIKHGCK